MSPQCIPLAFLSAEMDRYRNNLPREPEITDSRRTFRIRFCLPVSADKGTATPKLVRKFLCDSSFQVGHSDDFVAVMCKILIMSAHHKGLSPPTSLIHYRRRWTSYEHKNHFWAESGVSACPLVMRSSVRMRAEPSRN